MKHHRLVPIVGAALVLAACSGSGDETDPVAGEPVLLRMGSPYASLVATPAVEHFVDEVGRLSDGAVTIEIAFEFDGDETFGGQPDGEQQVVQAVADGDFDLAWAGTRVFDTFGVTGFPALHAPLLVDSYELQAAILDSDIPERLLAELDGIGVTGLSVLAGGLRKPIGVDGPLLRPGDFDGITFQYYRSDVQAAAVAALGATPTDVVGYVRDDGLAADEIDGIEHTLRTWVTRTPGLAPYVTANVNLWPETTALIINADVLAGLTDTQAGWLHDAAADAAERSLGMHDVDAERAAEACEMGARFAEASDADLAAMRQAFEPVYAELTSDPLTAELITEITELKESVVAQPLAIPDGCTGEAPVASGADSDGLPPGTYTSGEVTVEQQVAAAVAAGYDADEAEAEVREGISEYSIFTLIISDAGRWTERCIDDGGPEEACFSATYAVDGDQILLTEGGCTRTMRFTVDGDQLHLEYLDVECTNPADAEDHMFFEPMIYSAVPFTRVD